MKSRQYWGDEAVCSVSPTDAGEDLAFENHFTEKCGPSQIGDVVFGVPWLDPLSQVESFLHRLFFRRHLFGDDILKLTQLFRRSKNTTSNRPRIDGRIAIESLETRELLTVFTVVNTLNSGPGSLRQAILSSNATAGNATNTINFKIPGSGVKTINIETNLAAITHPVTINGSSQPGFVNTPVVVINNVSNAPADTDGFFVRAANSTIQDLAIDNFKLDAVVGYGATNLTLSNDYIGVNASGTSAAGNGAGVLLVAGTQNSTIKNCVISGNSGQGILISGGTSANNQIMGCKIGTNAGGTRGIGNGGVGIEIQNGAHNNTVGGTSAALSNVISGNKAQGVYIHGKANANTLLGNFIGTDLGATKTIGNALAGVAIWTASNNNVIGGDAPGAGNVISGNSGNGIRIDHNSNATLIQGNFIGTDRTGTLTLNNQIDGVNIQGGSANTMIGGTTAGSRNQIVHQRGAGIDLYQAGANTVIQNNLIKFNGVGSNPNFGDGVLVLNTPGATITGSTIGSNRDYGIYGFASPGITNSGNTFGGNGKGSVKIV